MSLRGFRADGICLQQVRSSFWQILLQKSKLAVVQISSENQKRKEADDSNSLSGATEVAHEFGAGR